MRLRISTLTTLVAAALAATPILALAQAKAEGNTYRCVGKDGRKYYGQTLPHECLGRPVELLNSRGLVVKRIDPQGDAQTRAARKAAAAKKAEEEAAAKEQRRRDRALLATYQSEKDVEDARARALADNQKSAQEIEARIGEIKKRQARNEKELEFYTGKNKPPARLEMDIHNAAADLERQQQRLAAKIKEVDSINAKYNDDKVRLRELRGGQ